MLNAFQEPITKLVNALRTNGFYGGLKAGDRWLVELARQAKVKGHVAPVGVFLGIGRKRIGYDHVKLFDLDGREVEALAWDPDHDSPEIAADKLRITLAVLGEWLGEGHSGGKKPGRKRRQPDKLDGVLQRDFRRGDPDLEDHKWAAYLDNHRSELPKTTTADKIRMRYNRLKGSPEANG